MQELYELAEEMNLPTIFCDQLQAGQRLTMWAQEVTLTRSKVWDIYKDDKDDMFQLRLQIQGKTGTKEQGFPLVALPEDFKGGESHEFWSIQGYVAVNGSSLEPEVLKAFEKFSQWTSLNKGTKQDESSRPKLWFEAGDESCGLQLIPKAKIREGTQELSFSGWAHRGLEWHGTGIRSIKEYQLDEFFTNGNRGGRGAQVTGRLSSKTQVSQVPQVPIPYSDSDSDVPY